MKKVLFAIIFCIAFASIVNSLHAISVLFQKRELLISAQNSLEQEKKENKRLTDQLRKISNKEFVEKEARNKLFFVKPGENTVFIAKELITSQPKEKPVEKEISNWEKWIKLFL